MKNKGAFLFIIAIISALLVHIMHCIPAPNDWLVAKWSAGEILTYLGTVVLGWLAIKQNDELKKENDSAQERLENISREANQINILSKVIEYEISKKQNLESAISVFEKVTNSQYILKAHAEKENSISLLMGAESEVDEAYLRMTTVLDMDYYSTDFKSGTYQQSVYTIFVCTKNLIEFLRKNDVSKVKDLVYEMNKERLKMEETKKLYLGERQHALDELLYDVKDIRDVKKIY